MKIGEKFWEPVRRAGLRALGGHEPLALRRKTAPLPSLLQTYGARTEHLLPKRTPEALRRFAETPIARKAINTIKDRVAGMSWRIQPRRGRTLDAEMQQRIQVLTETLEQPNPDDSFRSMAEQVLEDIIVGGYGAMELRLTGDERKPLALYPVDGATVQMRADWDGAPDSPRYVQMTGAGSVQRVELNDNELSYIRLNPRSYTPFGLGRLEVAFETIHEFLGAHRFAAKLASNTVVQYALWMQELDPGQHERLIRWWQDEIEGTGRVPILTAENKPEVLRFGVGTDADLRLAWQEFLIRVIASAFDLPPLFLGVEADVNRSTAQQLADSAFRTAIVPTAKLLAEHITRDAIAKRLRWNDLEFVFMDLDATDPMEQAQIDQILLSSGVLTVNEARAARGWQALENSEAPAR